MSIPAITSKKTLAYGTGLLVGDLWLARSTNKKLPPITLDAFLVEIHQKYDKPPKPDMATAMSEWDRGFDRALAGTTPHKAVRAKHLDQDDLYLIASAADHTGVIAEMLKVIERMTPKQQQDVIEISARLMLDMHDRLTGLLGVTK